MIAWRHLAPPRSVRTRLRPASGPSEAGRAERCGTHSEHRRSRTRIAKRLQQDQGTKRPPWLKAVPCGAARVRLDKKATSISLLVVLGVRCDGQKVLLAVRNMGGESEAAWQTLLDDLVGSADPRHRDAQRSRGLVCPLPRPQAPHRPRRASSSGLPRRTRERRHAVPVPAAAVWRFPVAGRPFLPAGGRRTTASASARARRCAPRSA